jgi:hypothetical protein
MANIVGNENKLQELILYISQKCANDPTFGAVKLNKILYFSDFEFYAKSGTAITNVEYQKLPNGPAPRRLLPVRDQMIGEGTLAIQEVLLRSGNTQKRTVNLRQPDLSVFTAAEIALVDQVIESFDRVDAKETSDRSHEMVGWLVTREGEVIPYNTVYLSNPPLTEFEKYSARQYKLAKMQAVKQELNAEAPNVAH